MPLCFDKYEKVEKYLADKDILIRKRICTIISERDLWGDRAIIGGPKVIDYSVSLRTPKTLKTAYVKLGNVPLGWFSSTPQQGAFIEEIPLPKPFKWVINWPPLFSIDKLVDCDIPAKIQEEFGIRIDQYLGTR